MQPERSVRRRARLSEQRECAACGLPKAKAMRAVAQLELAWVEALTALQRLGFDTRTLPRRYTPEPLLRLGFIPGQALFEVDHILPLWAGGEDVESNLQLLCFPCHAKKTSEEAGDRAVRRKLGAVESQPRLIEREPDDWPSWFRPQRECPRQARNVARGLHPLGSRLGPEGLTCGRCSHLRQVGRFWKCAKARQSASVRTDVRKRWRACEMFEGKRA